LRRFKIFILSETFLESTASNAVEVKFKDFVLRWVPAIRTSTKGRASGGMISKYIPKPLIIDATESPWTLKQRGTRSSLRQLEAKAGQINKLSKSSGNVS